LNPTVVVLKIGQFHSPYVAPIRTTPLQRSPKYRLLGSQEYGFIKKRAVC